MARRAVAGRGVLRARRAEQPRHVGGQLGERGRKVGRLAFEEVAAGDVIALEVEDAGIIPGVLNMAEVTLATAKDQKQFGTLKDDPLCIQGIAYIMKYSAEDTHPTFYGDMNNKCYLKDRTNIDPYGKSAVSTLHHMKKTKPFPNGTVTRGVKADLRDDYKKGREFTWHGFCSTTKSISVLNNSMFCGHSGKRTIFQIALTQGQVSL